MNPTGEIFFAILAFCWGAAWGSFVNVVAWRVPLGRSVVSPPSQCPACRTPIRWYHNLPVAGWLFLKGKCAACGVPVSFRYPLVEATVGLGALAFWLLLRTETPMPRDFLLDAVIPFVLHVIFIAGLVALTLIDLDWFLLPDRLTFGLLGLGLVAAVATPRAPDATEAALGVVFGGLVPAIVMWLYLALTGRAGMGGGDWKLLAAIGAWLGIKAIPFVLGAAAVQGLVTALLYRRDFARESLPPLPDEPPLSESPTSPTADPPTPFMRLAVPFGPFLALAAFEWLLFGPDLLALARR